MPIRVFLISNHRLLLCGLAQMIEARQPGFVLAGHSDSLAQAFEPAAKAVPDVVLLDIDSDGAEALTLVSKLHNASNAKVMLLTRMDDLALQDKAILAGGRGVINRDATADMLFNAVQKVHAGQIWLDHEATGRVFVQISLLGKKKAADPVAANVAQLTEREQQIVALIARGNGESGKAIAEQLCISESTLRNHLTAIYGKLGVANRHGLLAYAFQNGLTERLGQ